MGNASPGANDSDKHAVAGRYIISLNWVDGLSLFGLVLCLWSIGLALAGKFSFAVCLMLSAMLIDMLDGYFARKCHLLRPFGRYLDGTIDVFDYLVVPPLILYLWGFDHWLYVIAMVVFVLCGVVRLSVFNDVGNVVNSKGRSCYLGVPVFWIQFLLALVFLMSWWIPKVTLFPYLAALLFIYSFFMVYRCYSFKFADWKTVSGIIFVLMVVFGLHGVGLIVP